MKMRVEKIVRAGAMGVAVMLSSLSARAEKYQIVSNLTNAVFSSSGKTLQAVGSTPIDKVVAGKATAALVEEAHSSMSHYPYPETNLCKGVWCGSLDIGMLVTNIVVTETDVILSVLEKFLVYTNATTNSKPYPYYESGSYRYANYNVASTDRQSVKVEQECNPPDPWTARGTWAPYCRDEMTNRIEVIEHYEGVTREVVGYYDADGDGYATLSRVGVVNGSKGDYLDELADGPYWIVNDVLITKYTIPRNSFLNWVYGTEDAQNHYWYAIKAFYQITLETTPLRPWWQLPEYQ